jgi:colanic acid/amylovoran biosynthesis glycosyltransferase
MRIVYVVSQYPCLSETFVAREIDQLVKMGQEIIICPLRPPVKTNGPSGLEVFGARVLRSPLTPWGLLGAQGWLLRHRPAAWRACWRDVLSSLKVSRLHHLLYILLVTTWLARYLQNLEVDHIRGHFLHSEAISCMWLSRIIKKPYSLTAHTDILLYPKSFITKVVNGAAFVAGISQHECDFLKEIRNQDVFLIYNGIDLEDFPVKDLHLGRQPPMILAIGTLEGRKGFDILIEACALLKQRGFIFTCRIIGEGRERGRLEKLVRHLGLEEIVHLPGAMAFQQLQQEFTKATILVMPSKPALDDHDGLPTVLFESMALGTPVVSTRLAGIPDLVKDGETGLLAEPGDPESLSGCMERLLEDHALQQRLALAGRKLVEAGFDIRNSVKTLLGLITPH